MVGLVLVSHSYPLAQAARELALQVAEASELPIAACGGVGDEHEELGTDATEIMEAVESVRSEEGVLLLMDLGSAILSAEMALELLDEETPVRLSPAPLVEGAVAAAVQISLGSDLETVYREALSALEPKREQLGAEAAEAATPGTATPGTATPGAAGTPATEDQSPGDDNYVQRSYRIMTPHGLHARPAAQFVQAVAASGAEAEAAHEARPERWVNARSLNRIATLAVRSGERVLVRAPAGEEAEDLFSRIETLVAENFGEEFSPSPAGAAEGRSGARPPEEGAEQPREEGPEELLAVSPGIAVGPVHLLSRREPRVSRAPAEDPKKERERLRKALEQVEDEIEAAREEMNRRGARAEAGIFDAHLLILKDPEFLGAVENRIESEGKNASLAVQESGEESAATYRALEDPYMKARAADVEDVTRRLLFALEGEAAAQSERPREPVIVAAEELGPSETVALSPDWVLGIVTRVGDLTSHAAVLSRALGVPAVTGYARVGELSEGDLIVLDAGTPRIIEQPTKEELGEYRAAEAAWKERVAALKEVAQAPGRTADGASLPVYANIARPSESENALENGADGVGLFRSEFLFLHREAAPEEKEQAESFAAVAQSFGDRPVVLRLLDIGGDKQISYLSLPTEANPFLGVRGVRLYRHMPELFMSHLRAALRGGAGGDLRLMIPMVVAPEEVEEVRERLSEAQESLAREGVEHRWPVKLGIMIETPGSVEMSGELAKVSDFFSIGTNDLTQYVLAAERGNQSLAYLSDALHPGVLRTIARVVESAKSEGLPCGVCGELGGDPAGAIVLSGLGVTSLSASGASIPRVKDAIRRFGVGDARELAQRALSARTAEEVRRLCNAALEEAGVTL
ncbi:MAG: phosphoenolpyruvate--protein phosphotransferase [Alkalispirochaetaceae bacterium]